MTAELEDYLQNIERAAAADAWYASLALALAIPDICGGIEYPPPINHTTRYTVWCNDYVRPLDSNLTGADVWTLRCSFLHTGTGRLEDQQRAFDKSRLGRIVLLRSENPGQQGATKMLIRPGTTLRSEYALPFETFVRHLARAARTWHEIAINDARKAAELRDLYEIMNWTYVFEGRV
jgi:hypothetical protein